MSFDPADIARENRIQLNPGSQINAPQIDASAAYMRLPGPLDVRPEDLTSLAAQLQAAARDHRSAETPSPAVAAVLPQGDTSWPITAVLLAVGGACLIGAWRRLRRRAVAEAGRRCAGGLDD